MRVNPNPLINRLALPFCLTGSTRSKLAAKALKKTPNGVKLLLLVELLLFASSYNKEAILVGAERLFGRGQYVF